MILTGIEELATKPDLLDRSIIQMLPRIPSGNGRTEEDFWCAFEEARGPILGALLDAAATAQAVAYNTAANAAWDATEKH